MTDRERHGISGKSEHELITLEDPDLIAYAVAARDRGDHDEFVRAIRIFVWKREPMVKGLVHRKISHAQDRENVIQEVLLNALESADRIKGSHTGEFVNWLITIVRYRVADYHERLSRSKKNERSADAPLTDDDNHMLDLADGEDEYGAVAMLDLIHEVLESRSEIHRRTIELRMDGHPTLEVVEMLGDGSRMTPANADKVFSRFRADVKRKLRKINES